MRDPVNELYGRACDVLEAAQHLRRACARAGAERGLAPTLACVQAAAGEMARGFDTLRSRLDRESAPEPDLAALVAAVDALTTRLSAAEDACDAARAASARIGVGG